MIWRNSIETKFDGINFYGMKIEVDGQTKYYQGVFHTNDSYHSGNFIAVRRVDVGHEHTVCFNLRTNGGEFSEYCVKDTGQVLIQSPSMPSDYSDYNLEEQVPIKIADRIDVEKNRDFTDEEIIVGLKRSSVGRKTDSYDFNTCFN